MTDCFPEALEEASLVPEAHDDNIPHVHKALMITSDSFPKSTMMPPAQCLEGTEHTYM